jgi:hypothetical protein
VQNYETTNLYDKTIAEITARNTKTNAELE